MRYRRMVIKIAAAFAACLAVGLTAGSVTASGLMSGGVSGYTSSVYAEETGFEIHGTFRSGYFDTEIVFSGDHGYFYKDSYFDQPAEIYNHSLATMSLCASFSAYGVKPYSHYDAYIRELMTECGFAEDGRYEQYHFNEKPEINSIGCAIGSKVLPAAGADKPQG